jgi:hypothetical protein
LGEKGRLAGYATRFRHLDPVDPYLFARDASQLPAGRRVVLVARKSRPPKVDEAKLRLCQAAADKALAAMRRIAEQRGWVVVGGFAGVYSGKHLDCGDGPRIADFARAHDAAVVFESLDRLKRSWRDRFVTAPDGRSAYKAYALTQEDYDDVQAVFYDLQLYVIVPPDASPAEVRSAQTKRGQGEDRKGGRPRKFSWRPFRARWIARVLQLARAGEELERKGEGRFSHADIARYITLKAHQDGSLPADMVVISRNIDRWILAAKFGQMRVRH